MLSRGRGGAVSGEAAGNGPLDVTARHRRAAGEVVWRYRQCSSPTALRWHRPVVLVLVPCALCARPRPRSLPGCPCSVPRAACRVPRAACRVPSAGAGCLALDRVPGAGHGKSGDERQGGQEPRAGPGSEHGGPSSGGLDSFGTRPPQCCAIHIDDSPLREGLQVWSDHRMQIPGSFSRQSCRRSSLI